MATTNATISIDSAITDSSLSISNNTLLNLAGSTNGVNTLTSVTKTLSSTTQADLITTASVATTHAYVYINNPSIDETEFFKLTIGAHDGAEVEEIGIRNTSSNKAEHVKISLHASASTDVTVQIVGRLYGGDFMWFPWDVDDDITCIPSTAEDMVIEYMVFS